jgi:hypothetical protein
MRWRTNWRSSRWQLGTAAIASWHVPRNEVASASLPESSVVSGWLCRPYVATRECGPARHTSAVRAGDRRRSRPSERRSCPRDRSSLAIGRRARRAQRGRAGAGGLAPPRRVGGRGRTADEQMLAVEGAFARWVQLTEDDDAASGAIMGSLQSYVHAWDVATRRTG